MIRSGLLALVIGGAPALLMPSPSRADDSAQGARAKLAEEIYNQLYEQTVQEMVAPPASEPNPPAGTDHLGLDALATKSEQFYLWSRRWMEARRDAATTKEGRVAAVTEHLDRMKSLEPGVLLLEVQKRLGRGDVKPTPEDDKMLAKSKFGRATKYFRLEAEAWLAEAKK